MVYMYVIGNYIRKYVDMEKLRTKRGWLLAIYLLSIGTMVAILLMNTFAIDIEHHAVKTFFENLRFIIRQRAGGVGVYRRFAVLRHHQPVPTKQPRSSTNSSSAELFPPRWPEGRNAIS